NGRFYMDDIEEVEEDSHISIDSPVNKYYKVDNFNERDNIIMFYYPDFGNDGMVHCIDYYKWKKHLQLIEINSIEQGSVGRRYMLTDDNKYI
ncbi:MAG: hypothetical protein V4668_02280, partial [Patescibacteria group bacterium]